MAFGDVVQVNSGTGTTATTAPTLPGATTAGNLLVLTFAADDYNGTPNTGWTQSSECEQQFFHGGYLWWCIATAGMTVPSYTIGSAVRSAWTLVEYEGPFDASPYDGSQGTGASSSASTTTTDSLTPTAGDRLLVAHLALSHANNDLSALGTFTNSFTQARGQLSNGANPRFTITQNKLVVTANGSTAYSTAASDGNGQARSSIAIAFKKGASGGASGTLSKTLPAPGVATAGAVAVKAALSKALAAPSLSTSGKVAIAGALSATMPAPSIAAAGGIPGRSGVLSAALPAPGITSAGAVALTGILSKALLAPSVAATGKVAVSGTLSKAMPSFALAATGLGGPLPTIEGVLAATMPPFGLVATGTVPEYIPAATGWSDTAKGANVVLSNGGLTALSGAGVSYEAGAATVAITSGQLIYFEVKMDVTSQSGATAAGLANASNTYGTGEYLGKSNNSIAWFDDGTVYRNDALVASYGVPVQGDTIGIAVKGGDRVWFSKGGVWQSGDPNTLTGGIDISTLGDVYPAYSVVGTIARTQVTGNFGATATAFAKPTGFTTQDQPPAPAAAPAGGAGGDPPKRQPRYVIVHFVEDEEEIPTETPPTETVAPTTPYPKRKKAKKAKIRPVQLDDEEEEEALMMLLAA